MIDVFYMIIVSLTVSTDVLSCMPSRQLKSWLTTLLKFFVNQPMYPSKGLPPQPLLSIQVYTEAWSTAVAHDISAGWVQKMSCFARKIFKHDHLFFF